MEAADTLCPYLDFIVLDVVGRCSFAKLPVSRVPPLRLPFRPIVQSNHCSAVLPSAERRFSRYKIWQRAVSEARLSVIHPTSPYVRRLSNTSNDDELATAMDRIYPVCLPSIRSAPLTSVNGQQSSRERDRVACRNRDERKKGGQKCVVVSRRVVTSARNARRKTEDAKLENGRNRRMSDGSFVGVV